MECQVEGKIQVHLHILVIVIAWGGVPFVEEHLEIDARVQSEHAHVHPIAGVEKEAELEAGNDIVLFTEHVDMDGLFKVVASDPKRALDVSETEAIDWIGVVIGPTGVFALVAGGTC